MNVPLKSALRESLLAIEAAALADAEAAYAAFVAEAMVDRTEVVADDELSQAIIATDHVARAESQVHAHREHAAAVEALDLTARDTVGPGALVRLEGQARWLLVSLATPAFTCQGAPVLGISPDSPLARAMEGLEAGDTFDVNGRELTIAHVA